MTHLRAKLFVAAVGLGLALSYLAVAGVKQGWIYHLQVDTYLAENHHHPQRVRLCGKVAPESFRSNPGRLTASFTLNGETRSLPVAYRGVIPDLFKPGCEVIVEGKLDDAGVFQADLMMTKCASKYDPAQEGSPHAEHPR